MTKIRRSLVSRTMAAFLNTTFAASVCPTEAIGHGYFLTPIDVTSSPTTMSPTKST